MATPHDGRSPPRRRPGPKPRGRTVVPLTITVTHAQRAALETLADAEKSSISTVVRRFVAAGLIAGALLILSTLRDIVATRRSGAGALWAVKEPIWTRTLLRAWRSSRSRRVPSWGGSSSRSST